MKILLAGVHFEGSFARSISQALKRTGHEVLDFEYRLRPRLTPPGSGSTWRKYVMPRKLLSNARRFKPDLLWITKGEAITGAMVRAVRDETGCLAINWFPDPYLFGHPNVVDQLPHLDLFLSKNPIDLGQLGLTYPGVGHLLQHSADKALHVDFNATPETLEQHQCDVAIVGGCYPFRESLLSSLLDYDLRIWGPGWTNSRLAGMKPECVVGTDARGFKQATVFQGAKVNLNTHHPLDASAMNQRIFDIAGSGGCQLADGPRELDGMFEDGVDLMLYSTASELRSKLDYLLAHPDRRLQMARHARSKFTDGHTYEDRVVEVLDLLDSRR